jgi:hypothetical protein
LGERWIAGDNAWDVFRDAMGNTGRPTSDIGDKSGDRFALTVIRGDALRAAAVVVDGCEGEMVTAGESTREIGAFDASIIVDSAGDAVGWDAAI